jgi:hypothetical protein
MASPICLGVRAIWSTTYLSRHAIYAPEVKRQYTLWRIRIDILPGV